MESVLQWISQYGYAALFACLMFGIAGLPIPDETILVFCGYLIATGRMQPALAFATGLAGAMAGITLSYWIGRTAGHAVVERYGRFLHVTPRDLDRVHSWFDRFGNWLLTIGYFIPGVRHFTALVAGISRLEMKTFAAFAYAGAAIWVGTFLTLGYFFGENWQVVDKLLSRYTLPFMLVGAVICALLWWALKRRSH
jgi:membrane protein DedA with SNARE-associated domain